MTETCDRCGARAQTGWTLAVVVDSYTGHVLGLSLFLCDHHTDRHEQALKAQGFVLTRHRVPVAH